MHRPLATLPSPFVRPGSTRRALRGPNVVLAACVGVLLAAAACTPGSMTVPPVETLSNAPRNIRFGQGSLSLTTDVERVGGPDAPSLTVRLVLRSDGAPLPDGSTFDALFVVYDGAVWSTRLENVPRVPAGATELEFTATGGPRWPPGERVDVIARVAPYGRQAFLIRAEDQVIGGS